MKKLHTRLFLALALVTSVVTGQAEAQNNESVALNQFRASETPNDAFSISRPDDLGHMNLGAQLHIDYANDPLVYEQRLGDSNTEEHRIVAHELTAQVGLSFGLFDRLVIYAGVPVVIWMDGEDDGAQAVGIPPADGFGLGDVYLGARFRILGESDDVFALGLQVTGTFPTGQGNWRGDNFLSIEPELLAEIRADILRITMNVGARIRDDADFTPSQSSNNETVNGETVTVGDQLTYALGITVPLFGDHREPGTSRLDLHAQVWGATNFTNFFGREESPFEALGGLKFHHNSGLSVGLAAGAGLNRGIGSPDFRAILQAGWTPAGEAAADDGEEEVTEAVGDADGDGIPDDVDQCIDTAEDFDGFEDEDGCPDLDNDGDGVVDTNDNCPDVAGLVEANGCPDGDTDGDGVPDSEDACPEAAEDMDGFEDGDGCPDTDNDGDGVVDSSDRCPNEAGPVANGGCPDTDRDGDGVVDRLDNCPDEAGTADNHGCEEEQQVVIREGRLEILDKVYFATNSDRIQRRSFSLLDNVAQVINNHPEITLIRIEGHTDDRGDDNHNMDLSNRRAAKVLQYLVQRGEVDESRLRSRGFGETRPIESNDTREGRAANRRVEFNLGEEGSDIQQSGNQPTADTSAD